MIKSMFHLRKFRKQNKRDRKKLGLCRNCGGRTKCLSWCRGPIIRNYIWAFIKVHKIEIIPFLWNQFKRNLEWFGVEPWHRYE